MQHWDILLSNQVNKKAFIDTLLSGEAKEELAVFNNQKGILFSDIAIEKFIEKEYQYDTVEASPESNRQLRTFSSGERKKEFLKYCINQNPDFIIFDNPFDHLDQASRVLLAQSLEKLTDTIAIIQLVNRVADVLDFVPNKAQIKDNSFELHPISKTENHFKTFNTSAIPKAIEAHNFHESVLIKMENVSVSYDDRKIVDNISWTIKQGEFWQLIGPNGAGKSTILSLITGDNPKGFGQNLFLFGRKKGSGESVWDIKKQIGIFTTSMTDLFQKNHSLEQMILSGFFDSIGLYNQPSALQTKIVDQWLEVIEMNHLKKKRFTELSVGQQRVVLIVRAVLKHPPLLILDEPVEGLDDENVDLVIQLINTIKQETNVSILYVSHRIESGLAPTSVFELLPKSTGSIGKIKYHSELN
ncbi:ATP-binding cassette domain-containing protein [Flavobacterium sp. JLP]|uniref:ATP-binding cassette domain-containing protein n=1 Tax=unclassified Flavobacterium TaxID=196869 RepID=UPI00188B30A6|nr:MULTISPECIES: ATP-binding cassette domain-containing protein [unclassified Flavobacterium]MBF4491580.1 ATP-binding cassette domain-containing protein [Flavobacterium sp. MR2016-29]MBF4505604.1 ATP-binding cassette domain-containing protein [Flavobacterium sp. JLP]